jgi:hypothetical protein
MCCVWWAFFKKRRGNWYRYNTRKGKKSSWLLSKLSYRLHHLCADETIGTYYFEGRFLSVGGYPSTCWKCKVCTFATTRNGLSVATSSLSSHFLPRALNARCSWSVVGGTSMLLHCFLLLWPALLGRQLLYPPALYLVTLVVRV